MRKATASMLLATLSGLVLTPDHSLASAGSTGDEFVRRCKPVLVAVLNGVGAPVVNEDFGWCMGIIEGAVGAGQVANVLAQGTDRSVGICITGSPSSAVMMQFVIEGIEKNNAGEMKAGGVAYLALSKQYPCK